MATSDAAVVDGFAAAAAGVRAAQSAAIEGRDGPDIRSALKDLRERSAELVRLAEAALGVAGRRPVAGEVNARLSQVATNDVAVAQLLVGILGSGDTAPTDLFGGLEPAARDAAPARPATTTPTTGRAATKTRTTKRAGRERTDAATVAPERPVVPRRDVAAERAARAEHERRSVALAEANRDHAAAVKARTRADAGVGKAHAAVEKARDALAAAETALADATVARDDAATAADAAASAVDEARDALAALGA